MVKKPKRKKKEQHPTVFALDGTIQVYEDGSMLELHAKVTPDEWEMIVEETVKYRAFVECLKEIAVPALEERWEDEDDWFRIQLDVAISRMLNIDTLLVSKFNHEEIKKTYADAMKKNSAKMLEFIEQVRAGQRAIIEAKLKEYKDSSEDSTKVSDL